MFSQLETYMNQVKYVEVRTTKVHVMFKIWPIHILLRNICYNPGLRIIPGVTTKQQDAASLS